MFRKDPGAVKAWDEEKPLDCAKSQREIITRAAAMLAPGGYLLYSTCTFSPEENEQIAYSLEGFHVTASKTFWPHIDHTDGFYAAVIERD